MEFIDRERIVCAVVLEIRTLRLRLLTEHNREVRLSMNRLTHRAGDAILDISMGREKLVRALKETAGRRESLAAGIDIRELWEVFNSEQQWIDLATMTGLCFPENPDADHESAVVRVFFNDRLYFKFNSDRFFPNSQARVEQIIAQKQEAERKKRLIDIGVRLIRRAADVQPPASGFIDSLDEDARRAVEILRSYYLFGKDSPEHAAGKAMAAGAGIRNHPEALFDILVRLGVWSETENIDLYRLEIPVAFPGNVLAHAARLVKRAGGVTCGGAVQRKDLTDVPAITIDGQATLDYDDAISLEKDGDEYRLGVHIADVGHYIRRDDPIDLEARNRASAIYTPDLKIPMIPPELAEDLCSLRAGEIRPAITLLVRLNSDKQVLSYDIFPSWIRVEKQWSYYDVNLVADQDETILTLHEIAKSFRQYRLSEGAIHISLPEITIWVDEDGMPVVHRINRESPGRLLVAEIMIMVNWLMAKFLKDNGMPAIFRYQGEPKQRLYCGEEEGIFQNWMQRKLLSRFILGSAPDFHTGLGLDGYVTATSPIRKYSDLVTQRQIRAIMGIEKGYSKDEMDQLIQVLQQPMSHVARVQNRRQRYWLLKYLEGMGGSKLEAVVLGEKRSSYLILLKEYMIEATLPKSGGIDLKREDVVQVTIQYANARKNVLTVYLG